ncbi:MAG: excinuclease ABC subunit UvrC [Acidobacteria bacterium]|nr:excinuclease ABC subunit UvrC [Acidobacteriota bacterium]
MPSRLKAKLASLPKEPGVYLFKNERGEIIYIGKAKSLKNRVPSYFHQPADPKQASLASEIADIDFIVTGSEVEALILENNLIKKEKPRYNVLLRDDKNYPYLKLTVNEDYPRVMLVRRVRNDGALYFGPYVPGGLARKTLKLISRYFMIRQCNREIGKKRYQPCLNYQIKRCLAPCAGLVSREEYAEAVEDVKLLLRGKNRELIDKLKEKMERASANLEFEKAARFRDAIALIERISERQRMAMTSFDEEDYFGYYEQEGMLSLEVFHVRRGLVVGRREFFFEELPMADYARFLSSVIEQYYLEQHFIPRRIYVPLEPEGKELLEEWLSERREGKVVITVPQRGKKRGIMELAIENARIALANRIGGEEGELAHLKRDLSLPKLPRRIEAFDISTVFGADTVASLVVFIGGKPAKEEYRHFKIEPSGKPDDYKAMAEVVLRRYRRVLEEGGELPDLILIDGGRGQVNAACSSLTTLDIDFIPVIGLAKEEELIYKLEEKEPIRLMDNSPSLKLLQRIRDEAHRFAITFHRRKRRERTITSELMKIPGVGKKRMEDLLTYFGSVDRVREASLEELAPIVGRRQAEKIIAYFASLDNFL